MRVLEEAGENPNVYKDYETTRLNSARVRRAYYQYKQTGFRKDFKPELY
jgi:hypothetical protein